MGLLRATQMEEKYTVEPQSRDKVRDAGFRLEVVAISVQLVVAGDMQDFPYSLLTPSWLLHTELFLSKVVQ